MKITEKDTLLEAAHKLVARFCPDLDEFKPVVTGKKQWSYHVWEEGKDNESVIRWRVKDGLHTLMHEIGHHVLAHGKGERPPLFREKVMWEVEAWLWAEKKCRALDIPFDYACAETAFMEHFKEHRQYMSVNIRWRYNHGRV